MRIRTTNLVVQNKIMQVKTKYIVLGAMAGSSMDGIDLSLVEFENQGGWQFKVVSCNTIPYEKDLYERLSYAKTKSRQVQEALHAEFGDWIGITIKDFLDGMVPDLLAVHGHTLIHAPEEGISWQLGDGQRIASRTGVPTITEFRSQDVSIGGQGAPLVPLGDFELFRSYDACLNLGGIANVSVLESKTAWDICPCNQVLNFYSNKIGRPFDSEGAVAQSGQLDASFISELEEILFFKMQAPKSLPNDFLPNALLEKVDPIIGLRSYTEFIALQLAKDLRQATPGRLLVTGGGAFNEFMVSRIKDLLAGWEVVIPNDQIISFKEALIFAFLGLKRLRGEINVLGSVTGATADSCSGLIHFPE